MHVKRFRQQLVALAEDDPTRQADVGALQALTADVTPKDLRHSFGAAMFSATDLKTTQMFCSTATRAAPSTRSSAKRMRASRALTAGRWEAPGRVLSGQLRRQRDAWEGLGLPGFSRLRVEGRSGGIAQGEWWKAGRDFGQCGSGGDGDPTRQCVPGEEPVNCVSAPIIIPVRQSAAYQLTDAAHGVLFDIDGDGTLDQVA